MQKRSKSKAYAFLNVLNHVYSEIGKRNGEELKSNPLALGIVKRKHKDPTPDKQNLPHHQFTNYYLNNMR